MKFKNITEKEVLNAAGKLVDPGKEIFMPSEYYIEHRGFIDSYVERKKARVTGFEELSALGSKEKVEDEKDTDIIAEVKEAEAKEAAEAAEKAEKEAAESAEAAKKAEEEAKVKADEEAEAAKKAEEEAKVKADEAAEKESAEKPKAPARKPGGKSKVNKD